MAASPDGVAVVTLNWRELIVASVGIKTRVAIERVTKAQKIAIKYQHKLITCDIGDDTWNECVEKEHSMQLLLQLWVMRLQTAFYIVALLGTSSSCGKICYIVMGSLSFTYADNFSHQYLDHIGNAMSTVDKVLEMIPAYLESSLVLLFKTRWPFFSAVQHHAISSTTAGFPPTTILKLLSRHCKIA
jgi:hypothetical protein